MLFRITAWSNMKDDGSMVITVAPSAKAPALATAFTAGSCSSTTCALSLPASKPATPQAEVQVTVPKNAPAETIKFNVTLTADNSGAKASKSAAQTVTVTKAAASSSSSPPASKSPSAGGAGSTTTPAGDGSTATISGLSGSLGDGTSIPVGPLPAVAGVSTTIPGGNAANLFPQISPSSTPSPAAGTPANAQGAQPVADSSRIPLALGSSEFGAQIVGLIVLLLGVAIAVTRLSIRRKGTTSTK